MTKLQKGVFMKADFRNATLEGAKAKQASFIGADLGKAKINKMVFDGTTILFDANLRGIIGDDDTVAALRVKKEPKEMGESLVKADMAFVQIMMMVVMMI